MKKVLLFALLLQIMWVNAFARDMIVPYQPKKESTERWNNPGPALNPGEWMHPSQRDFDKDGIPNYQDKDDDNDGIPDNTDPNQYGK